MHNIVLQKAFNAFDSEKKGHISTDMIGTILEMLGHPQTESNLKEIVAEVDVSGEYYTFCTNFLMDLVMRNLFFCTV